MDSFDAVRVLLIIGSLVTIIFMLRRIRKSQVQIKDSIFWLVFGLGLLIISVFPQIPTWASRQLGFAAPINFVYLFIIFILLIQLFSQSLKLSRLDARLQQLVQQQALAEKRREDDAATKAAGNPAGPQPAAATGGTGDDAE